MSEPTKASQAYYALNQAVNNFAWIRTNIFATEQKRREVILKSVEAVKNAAEKFLQIYSEENENECWRSGRDSATDNGIAE